MRRSVVVVDRSVPQASGHRRRAAAGLPPPKRNAAGRLMVLLAALVLGVVAVLVVAAVLAMVLLVAVFDFEASGPTECPDSSVPMLRAAYAGDTAEVERRIDEGERGATDDDGRTALYCAARGGQADIVRRLTAAGADPDVRNAAGDTPLLWAAQQGDIEVIDALLDTGAAVDLGTNAGQTPLLRAVYGGHADAVDHLLASGADPNLGGGADNFEAMLAVAAVLGGSPPDPGALAERVVPPNADIGTALGETTGTPADNITPLHAAVGLRRPDIVRSLLLAGADPDAVALGQYSPLHVSAFVGDADLAVLLLFGGADPTPPGMEEPAALARRLGHIDVAGAIDASAQAQPPT